MSSRAPLDTPNWHLGRNAEYLGARVFQDGSCRTLDIGGTTHASVPVLRGLGEDIVAPDLLAWRSGRVFGVQVKHKDHLQRWGGGSPLAVPRWPPRDEIGIDRVCYEQHLEFERHTAIPVVLAVLILATGTLHVASLSGLGPPRPSPNPDWDLVNWDIRALRPVWHCSPGRLRHVFFDAQGNHRTAPRDAPDAARMQRVMDHLQGCFFAGAMDAAEQEWLSAMVPA